MEKSDNPPENESSATEEPQQDDAVQTSPDLKSPDLKSPDLKSPDLKNYVLTLCRYLGRLLVWLGSGLFTLPIVFILMAGAFLGSESGRLRMFDHLIPELLADTAYRIEFEGLASGHLGQWSVKDLSIFHKEALVARAEELVLAVNLVKLFNQSVDVKELKADYLWLNAGLMERLLQPDGNDQQTASTIQMVPFRVANLNLKKIAVRYPNSDIPELAVSGNIELGWGDEWLKGALNLASVDNDTLLRLTGRLSRELGGTVALSLSEKPAGPLARQLALPLTEPLTASLQFDIAKQGELWDVQLNSLKSPWHSHKLEAQGRLSVDVNKETITTEGLSILVDSQPQNFSGMISREAVDGVLRLSSLPVAVSSFWQDWFEGGAVSGKVRLKGDLAAPEAEAALHLQTHYQGLPLDVRANLSASRAKIVLHQVEALLGEMACAVSGILDLEESTMDFQVANGKAPLDYLRLLNIEPVQDLELDVEVSNMQIGGSFAAPDYAGKVSVDGVYKGQHFSANSALQGTIEELRLHHFTLVAEASQVKASGGLNWKQQEIDLQVQATELPLRMLNLLGVEPPVAIAARIAADGALKGHFEKPWFKGKVTVQGTHSDELGITHIGLHALLKADWQKLTLYQSHASLRFPHVAQVKSTEGSEGSEDSKDSKDSKDSEESKDQAEPLNKEKKDTNSALTTLSVTGEYLYTDHVVNADVKFSHLPFGIYKLLDIEVPYQVSGRFDGDLKVSGALPAPLVVGSLKGAGMLENSPFTIEIAGQGSKRDFNLKAATATWGKARIFAKGFTKAGVRDFSIGVRDFNLEQLEVFGVETTPADTDVNLNLTGTAEQPGINGNFRLSRLFKDKKDEAGNMLQLVADSDVAMDGDIISVHSVFTKNGRQQGEAELTFLWPQYWQRMQRGEGGFAEPDLPVAVSLKGRLSLDWFEDFIDREIHRLRGNIDLDVIVSGQLSAPYLSGTAALKEGSYNNQITGTSLDNAEMDLLFEGQKLSIRQAIALDGKKGRLQAEGYVDWNSVGEPGEYGDVELLLTTSNVRLLRRDEVEGEATGNLEIKGDFRQLLISGEIDVSPFRLVLDVFSDASIQELEITVTEEAAGEVQADHLFTMPEITINVLMKASRQAFVRGRGLNAELEGEVQITGKLDKTEYSGRFGIVRGVFKLFNNKFELTNGGMLFDNDEISLHIEGLHEDIDYQYLATISGSLNDLEVELTTIPDLPQDEALSRLLFGKSVRKITPFQALRLAQALQELRGKSGGFNAVDSLRGMFQLDNLSLESEDKDEGTGFVVGLGKYVSETVYVELERSADSAQPWIGIIEVELTPKWYLNGKSDDNLDSSSVDLLWKQDY